MKTAIFSRMIISPFETATTSVVGYVDVVPLRSR